MGAEPSAHGVDVATIARHSQRRTLWRRARARRRHLLRQRRRELSPKLAAHGRGHKPALGLECRTCQEPTRPRQARVRAGMFGGGQQMIACRRMEPRAKGIRLSAGPPNQHPSVNGRVQNGKLAALSALGLPHCARSATLRQRSSHLSNGLFSCLTKHCRSPSTIALAS